MHLKSTGTQVHEYLGYTKRFSENVEISIQCSEPHLKCSKQYPAVVDQSQLPFWRLMCQNMGTQGIQELAWLLFANENIIYQQKFVFSHFLEKDLVPKSYLF